MPAQRSADGSTSPTGTAPGARPGADVGADVDAGAGAEAGAEVGAEAGRRVVRFGRATSADGTVLETWTNDAEGPTVLLCNGLGTSPWAWPALLDPACGLHVVSWNHRGVGRSARPGDTGQVGVDRFVEDALATMEAAGIERCVVMGWSFGVNTAFELALLHPDRVSGLFAVAGVPGGTFSSMGAPWRLPRPVRAPIALGVTRLLGAAAPVLNPVARRLPVGRVSSTVLRFSGFMFPTATGSDVRRAVREFLTTPIDWYMHLARHAAEHQRVSLSKVDVPAVFVAGRFDILASAADMRTAAERMSDHAEAEYVELWATHFLPLERPRTVVALARDFAESLASGPEPAPGTAADQAAEGRPTGPTAS